MNRLSLLKNIGVNITWKLIWVGLYGYEKIPPQLDRYDVLDYLYELLQHVDNTDYIISIICQCEDAEIFDKVICDYVFNDKSNLQFQIRKWRAYILKEILDDISPDFMQGLLSLMEYWTYVGDELNCPQNFPTPNDEASIKEYFNYVTYENILYKNRVWLEREFNTIIGEQTHRDGSSVFDKAETQGDGSSVFDE